MIGRKEQIKEQIPIKPITTGDLVVDGLFGGLVAGLAMAAVMVLLALLRVEPPDLLLSRFAAEETVSPWMGLLRHIAVSAIYGMVFGLLMRPLLPRIRTHQAAILAGLVYGIVLFILAEIIILPGTDSPLRAVPALEFGIAHLVYGLLLGIFLRRR